METPSPELEALTLARAELVRDCGATLGAIVDESSVVWCMAPASEEAKAIVDQFFRTEIAPNIKALLHGHRLSIHRASGPQCYVAESFAAVRARSLVECRVRYRFRARSNTPGSAEDRSADARGPTLRRARGQRRSAKAVRLRVRRCATAREADATSSRGVGLAFAALATSSGR